MSFPIDDTFTTQKNKKENTPILLYEVTIPTYGVARIAQWKQDVSYNSNTYTAINIRHEGITRNIMGEIDSIKIIWENINRQIGTTLQLYNGLKGCQVDIILVFLDSLTDATANMTERFWIDQSFIGEIEASFILTSKMDLHRARIPGRIQYRDFCGRTFKQKGCYILSGGSYVAPTGFVNAGVSCDHTRDGPTGCKYHNNSKRFGGFPGIPQRFIWIV